MSQYADHHALAEKRLRTGEETSTPEVRDACLKAAHVHAALAQAEATQEAVTMLNDIRGALGYVGEELSELVKQVRR